MPHAFPAAATPIPCCTIFPTSSPAAVPGLQVFSVPDNLILGLASV
jgi:hypothetical protein